MAMTTLGTPDLAAAPHERIERPPIDLTIPLSIDLACVKGDNVRLRGQLNDLVVALTRKTERTIDVGMQQEIERENAVLHDEIRRLRTLLGDHDWACRFLGQSDRCSWPGCGCDPAARRVLDHFRAHGYEVMTPSQLAAGEKRPDNSCHYCFGTGRAEGRFTQGADCPMCQGTGIIIKMVDTEKATT